MDELIFYQNFSGFNFLKKDLQPGEISFSI